jgi:hypothetical protein
VDLGFLEMQAAQPASTRRTRQDKPTVRIERRTLDECAARYAAWSAAQQLDLPAPDLNR